MSPWPSSRILAPALTLLGAWVSGCGACACPARDGPESGTDSAVEAGPEAGTDSSTDCPFGAPGGDSWRPISTVGAPPPGPGFVVSTGSQVLVTTGGRYDPVADTWAPISTSGAPTSGCPVWTGTEVIVIGDGSAASPGARYDPVADAWTPISTSGAPTTWSFGDTAVWTGTEVLAWYCTGSGAQGARYDPATDVWTPMSTVGAPGQLSGPAMGCWRMTSAWTGSEMLVANCSFDCTGLADGLCGDAGRYDPATDTWTGLSLSWCPDLGYQALWTGAEMILWSGVEFSRAYNPATGAWRTLSQPGWDTGGAIVCHAVWTGSLMLVWGVACGVPGEGGGARYDLATDTWCPISLVDAPQPAGGRLVWAGGQGVTWSGWAETAGRYTP